MKKLLSMILTIIICINTVSMAGGIPSIGEVPGELSGFNQTVSLLLGLIQWFGAAIAVGMLIYIGIKYVMASADGRASLKGMMIKYCIGVVILIGASTIAGIVLNLGASVGNAGG